MGGQAVRRLITPPVEIRGGTSWLQFSTGSTHTYDFAGVAGEPVAVRPWGNHLALFATDASGVVMCAAVTRKTASWNPGDPSPMALSAYPAHPWPCCLGVTIDGDVSSLSGPRRWSGSTGWSGVQRDRFRYAAAPTAPSCRLAARIW